MKIQTIAKFIDQPVILNKLHKHMPELLITAGTGFGLYDTYTHKKHKHRGLKNLIVIGTTIAASLLGTRGLKINGKKIFSGLMETEPLNELLAKQADAVNIYMKKTKLKDHNLLSILKKSKETHLSLEDIEALSEKLPKDRDRADLFNVILPDKKDLKSKEIFSEIKRLSLLGLIPVVGGIAGGIAGDKITHTSSRKSTGNKIKEGFYQYFANIFLCNVGAGAALFGAEKLNEKGIIKNFTPTKKLFTILAGITATGIIGGSFIANYLSKKVINPIFDKHKQKGHIYDERKPEFADVILHADDIATAGILSGFKWIEPALPFMYFVSGYRAGVGYRNNHKH